jgi:hypothetical protein
MMAVLTASGSGAPDMMCAMQDTSALTGMVPMYLLMSAFHAGPWLRLLSPRALCNAFPLAGQRLRGPTCRMGFIARRRSAGGDIMRILVRVLRGVGLREAGGESAGLALGH